MWNYIIFCLVIAANISGVSAQEAGTPIVFPEDLPSGISDGNKVYLLLDKVTVPGNIPLKLRVTTTELDSELFIGSTGIEALSPFDSTERQISILRIDVTRSIKQFIKKHPEAKTIELHIQPVDGKGKPIRNIKLEIRSVRFVIKEE